MLHLVGCTLRSAHSPAVFHCSDLNGNDLHLEFKMFWFLIVNDKSVLDCVWKVMAHPQKPDFVFQWNGRVYLNRQGCQFSRLLAAEVCASAVVMLDTPCSEIVWRILATHSIRQFPLHFASRASPCAITFQLDSTNSTVSITLIVISTINNPKKPN